jgi:hypothetical protein
MNTVPLEQLSFESFAGLVKTEFRVWVDAQDSLNLELTEITPMRISSTGGTNRLTYESFALVFLGPADRLLQQRIYWFESVSVGRFELFIVPVSRDPNGVRYQATFNRLVKSG